ncbi:hypothetical protein A3D05_00045 [Candidatus Gottesmanbacteria bacterium RIFCSPHIGHO2_02_FULL_40_24]|uniref:Uncharacterized protein n=1 Tax=Candidatus Gottesmanbacteria bacterium RIFCSPHIGHO2_01_FULL_40_15 TaxID=1798376 RepID=A0A1F5Z665_9BACT|nr:MAG: hypothetical protein A2777_00050 [Candidatus Gottesmanbacteria bacterium RIFCSPHIGHO2_01_FULL_40_15]OGG17745.1 MAG: hypothetical protein A3D05_00045 [Candidatus Gottesmanbacteria bacterium RIFCSPHIGHO2_02_FULL_40_24]OGG21858.1 MAG: hypothetical protein A3B48_03975 [Candidatus Gottesmanbacteria bacterium RIFCSPLOWO2_01_FULL_40_10]OGG25489.1 MAG: hypothetical protein A3E42_03515 [Candidatus Gottesmanbacteria bacterium RIFCSPHIGHO2_12_FULL_40_13]OGG33148.1 MAG: hypothetical protein A3I80_0
MATRLELSYPETPSLIASPILSAPQVHENGGLLARDIMESDKTVGILGNIPMTGNKLMVSMRENVLLWLADNGDGVMTAADKVSDIIPRSQLRIITKGPPDVFIASDIFSDNKADLIYIGRANGNSTKIREIMERTHEGQLTHIEPGSNEDDRFREWSVGYDGIKSVLSIYPGRGDLYLTYSVARAEKSKDKKISWYRRRLEAYQKYCDYRENGGVICWPLVGDALILSREEIKIKYPFPMLYSTKKRNHSLYTGFFEDQPKYIKDRTRIEMSKLQERVYLNLRNIPSESKPVHTYGEYGNTHPGKEKSGGEDLRHPAELSWAALLGQVLKLTGDIEKERQLEYYYRNHRV